MFDVFLMSVNALFKLLCNSCESFTFILVSASHLAGTGVVLLQVEIKKCWYFPHYLKRDKINSTFIPVLIQPDGK